MEKKTLRVAVIGAGAWAERAHIPGWQRDSRAEVVALVDLNLAMAQEVGAKFNIPLITDSYEEILKDPTIDVIDVATGNDAHFQVSMDAINAGKHVLCEKPVNRDARETQRLADLAKSKGVKTKLGFTFRYAPAVQMAKDLIDSGFIGEP